MSKSIAPSLGLKPDNKYEVQSFNCTLIISKVLSEIDSTFYKAKNAKLFRYNANGSKILIKQKHTTMHEHFAHKLKGNTEGESNVEKTTKPSNTSTESKGYHIPTMERPVDRKLKRQRDRSRRRKHGHLGKGRYNKTVADGKDS